MLYLHSYVFYCCWVGHSFLTLCYLVSQVVLALGFINVKDNSIAQNSYDGPGQELSSLILNLCGHDTKLIVQDDALKSVIEEKLVSIFLVTFMLN